MARTRTLTNLLADVRYQADVEGLTLRHPDANLTRAINQSIQEFREMLSENGSPYYLTSSTGPGSTPVGPTSGLAYGEVTITTPTDIVRIYGVDLTVGSRVVSLQPTSFNERNDCQGYTSIPEKFFTYSTTKLGFLPAADAAYPIRIWYLPVGTDLSAGGDTFDGQVGWEEWVVFSAAVKLVTRDDYPERYGMLVAERDRIGAKILSAATKRVRAGPLKRQDFRGRHLLPRIIRVIG